LNKDLSTLVPGLQPQACSRKTKAYWVTTSTTAVTTSTIAIATRAAAAIHGGNASR
jgi:hypothetical protein